MEQCWWDCLVFLWLVQIFADLLEIRPQNCALDGLLLELSIPSQETITIFGQIPQEPYQFADDVYEGSITYMDIMRTGIRNKYHMIRYYYTEMFKMSVFGTGPFFNPVFFHFPDDDFAFMDISNNIMLGGALKLSVLTNTLGVNSHDFYFPQGIWCNVFVPTEPCLDFSSIGQKITLNTKAYDFYVHLYEGHIVPL